MKDRWFPATPGDMDRVIVRNAADRGTNAERVLRRGRVVRCVICSNSARIAPVSCSRGIPPPAVAALAAIARQAGFASVPMMRRALRRNHADEINETSDP